MQLKIDFYVFSSQFNQALSSSSYPWNMAGEKGAVWLPRNGEGTYVYAWTIGNFLNLRCDIRSPVFQPLQDFETKWCAVLRTTNKGIDFYLVKVNENEKPLNVKVVTTVSDSLGKVFRQSSSSVLFDNQNSFHPCLSISSSIISTSLLGDNAMTVQLALAISPSGFAVSFESLLELSYDFERCLLGKSNTDITLWTGEENVDVHALICGARSSLLTELNEKPRRQGRKIFDATSINLSVLNALVSYLYTGIIDISKASLYDLYRAANTYSVSSLSIACSNILETTLTVNNVCMILKLAHKYKDEQLQLAAKDFICEHFCVLKTTNNWSIFIEENPSLVSEVLHYYYCRTACFE